MITTVKSYPSKEILSPRPLWISNSFQPAFCKTSTLSDTMIFHGTFESSSTTSWILWILLPTSKLKPPGVPHLGHILTSLVLSMVVLEDKYVTFFLSIYISLLPYAIQIWIINYFSYGWLMLHVDLNTKMPSKLP